ncbi:MAG TPA: 3'-5' exonuclease [Dysgonamonadaceae bacterium]|nr:3'-5' exonuclease [Dysgonamonadaceae bacterium]
MSILKSYPQLSQEQRELINFCTDTNENIFLEGPPMSGKTSICLYNLQNIIKKEGVHSLFMVSNNAMYGYISMALKELGISDNVTIGTKDKFFWKMGGEKRISISIDSDYYENYDRILTNLLNEEIEKKRSLTIVSEVQDYLPKEWKLIKRISHRILCYGDFKQAIFNKKNRFYRETLINDCIHKQLNYHDKNIETNELIRVRNYFFDDSENAETKDDNYLTLSRDNGLDVKYNVIDVEYKNELKTVAEILKALKEENSRVVIISPNNKRLSKLSIYLESEDIEHKHYEINRDLRNHDFTSTTPLFISVFNAEGLQFDDVILFGFDESNYIIEMKRKEDRLKSIIYVGMTRARNRTFIVRNENTVEELKAFEEK